MPVEDAGTDLNAGDDGQEEAAAQGPETESRREVEPRRGDVKEPESQYESTEQGHGESAGPSPEIGEPEVAGSDAAAGGPPEEHAVAEVSGVVETETEETELPELPDVLEAAEAADVETADVEAAEAEAAEVQAADVETAEAEAADVEAADVEAAEVEAAEVEAAEVEAVDPEGIDDGERDDTDRASGDEEQSDDVEADAAQPDAAVTSEFVGAEAIVAEVFAEVTEATLDEVEEGGASEASGAQEAEAGSDEEAATEDVESASEETAPEAVDAEAAPVSDAEPAEAVDAEAAPVSDAEPAEVVDAEAAPVSDAEPVEAVDAEAAPFSDAEPAEVADDEVAASATAEAIVEDRVPEETVETLVAPPPPAEIEDDGMSWYVVHTYSGYERKVKQSLEERVRTLELKEEVSEVLIPTEDVVEMKGGKKVVTAKKFFPGYVLVRMTMNDRLWHLVKNTPRVTGFVGEGRNPIALTQPEVDKILNRMEESVEAPKPKFQFGRGENVRIIDGPFTNFTGNVDEVDMRHSTLKVMVSIFGRATPVELDFFQVEKV